MFLIFYDLYISLNVPGAKDMVQLSFAAFFHLHSQSTIVLSFADWPHLQTLHLIHTRNIPKFFLYLVDDLNIVAAI